MAAAVATFDQAVHGPDAWLLGRFVVPASRLGEFSRALGAHAAARPQDDAWRLSVLLPPVPRPDVAALQARLADAATPAPAPIVEAIEMTVSGPGDIASLAEGVPPGVELFCEMPKGASPDAFAEAAAAAGCGLKLRTGSTTLDGFPATQVVADFLRACAAHRVPFKATAGLHHPLRSEHPVTYESGAPCATMHGFVNLFLGAVLRITGAMPDAHLPGILEERAPGAFVFSDDGAKWTTYCAETARIVEARSLARSFGSCSFDEPAADLRQLGWLPS